MSGSRLTGKGAVFLAAGLIVLAALAAYHGIFSVPLVFDDFNAVTLNPTIHHLWPPWEALRTPQGTGSETDGRPLANLSFALNYAISGEATWSYHAAALLLHALTALVLFGVVRRTLERQQAPAGDLSAFAIALLWAVHPLQTETVTTVAHRTELLVSLCYLLTLYCFIRSVPEKAGAGSPRGAGWWPALCVAACFLGMLSKEVMVSAPLIVFLYDRTFVAGSFAEAWRRRRGLHLALAGTWLVLAVLRVVSPQRGGTGGFGMGMSSWHYALTQCRALVLYLRLSLWPHPLVLDYGDGVIRQLGEIWPQGLLVLALLAGTGIALWRKPGLGFVGAVFFALLAPSSSFLPLVTQTIAEHRMYLPLAAVLTLVVCGLQAAAAPGGRNRALALTAGFVAAALGLAGATARRNEDFQSNLSIWADTAAKLPGNPRAHDNLANALLEANRTPEAVAQYRAALQLAPDDVQAHYNLGNVLLQAGDLPGAIAHYQAALRAAPAFDRALDNLGTAYLRAGRLPEALAAFAAAVAADPAYPSAHYNLANALARAGRLDAAIAEYRSAVRLAPGLTDAHFNLATALIQSGRTGEAMAEYEAVLRLNPADAEARADLARLRGP